MTPEIELLKMLLTATWDGNIPNKQIRDDLHKNRLIVRHAGWNYISQDGIDILIVLGLLKP